MNRRTGVVLRRAVASLATVCAMLAGGIVAGPPEASASGPLPIPPIPPLPPLPPLAPLPPLPPLPPPFGPQPEPPPAPPRPPSAGCTTAEHPFVPTSVGLPGIAEDIPVIALRRNAAGNPGVPPISREGKWEMAFDLGSGIRPGDPQGNALFNAHTWPDGSALGNRLLAQLHEGDPIIVHGSRGRICYRVTKREEVPADSRARDYFASRGRPQIAIAVCSGRRLGPGVWTRRTLWFASPEGSGDDTPDD